MREAENLLLPFVMQALSHIHTENNRDNDVTVSLFRKSTQVKPQQYEAQFDIKMSQVCLPLSTKVSKAYATAVLVKDLDTFKVKINIHHKIQATIQLV